VINGPKVGLSLLSMSEYLLKEAGGEASGDRLDLDEAKGAT
jgi:hypothetical protein